MKKTVLFIALLAIFSFTQAQTKILFLGNSFTNYYYNVPSMFNGFASTLGLSVIVDARTQPGMAVADEQTIGHINDATSQNKINLRDWDYVVVQDNLGDYAGSIGNLPSQCYYGNITLFNQIKANYSCSRIVYFAGWGPVGGTSSGDNTTSCINRIYGNMLALNNDTMHEIVSPIGKAWITSMSQLPAQNLYYSDNLHPSQAGAYLAAATIFTTIFKRDLTNVDYNPGITTEDAQTMRTIAYNTVKNTTLLTETNLSSYTPSITLSGGYFLSVTGGPYSSYQWFLDDVLVGTSSTYAASVSGKYQVQVVKTSDGCPRTSFVTSITLTGINDHESDNYTIAPISENIFELTSDVSGTISIYNMQGGLINTFEKNTPKSTIDLSNEVKGVYIILLKNSKVNLSRKISIN